MKRKTCCTHHEEHDQHDEDFDLVDLEEIPKTQKNTIKLPHSYITGSIKQRKSTTDIQYTG